MIVLLHFKTSGFISNMPVVENGYLFVDFFFVLSGFVIQANYADRMQNRTQLGEFLIRRFGRLYPLHLFMLFCFLGLELIQTLPFLSGLGASEPFSGEANSIFALATNVGLIHGLGMHSVVTWNSVSWSISTEFWAYVAFAITTFLAGKRILLVAVFVCISTPILIGTMSETNLNTTYDYGYLRCLFGFYMGIIAHELFQKFVRQLPQSFRIETGLEIAATLGIITYVSLVGESIWSLFAPIVFMAGILVFARSGGAISSILNTPFPLMLGRLSYSVYMVHVFIQSFWMIGGVLLGRILGYELVLQVARQNGDGTERSFGQLAWQGDLATLLMLGSVIFVSYFTYKWIEDPFRLQFNKLAKKFRVDREDKRAQTAP